MHSNSIVEMRQKIAFRKLDNDIVVTLFSARGGLVDDLEKI